MSLQEITQRELTANGVVSMPTRPNASREFGGRSYTPAQLKEAFDRLPRLVAERYNELVRQVESGDLAEALQVQVGEGNAPLATYLTDALTRLGALEEPLLSYIHTGVLEIETPYGATQKSAVNLRCLNDSLTALYQEAKLLIAGQRLSLEGGTLSLIDSDGNTVSAVETSLDAQEKRLALCEAILRQTTVTETEMEDTFTARVTADGMEVIDGAETEVKLVKGSTENREGTLVNATFSGITSSSADGETTSTYTLPTPVTLGFADVLNVEEGTVYRYTSNEINTWEYAHMNVYMSGNVVWAQFWFGDAELNDAVQANCNMQSKYISPEYATTLGEDATISMCNRVHPLNFVRMIVGTVAEVTGNSEATTATEDEIRTYLQNKNVVFVYQKTSPRTTEKVECPTGYTAYNGGTEQVEGNGMAVTVTQTYLTPKGAQ